MYLTSFRINTARAGARSLLRSPHRMHGAVTMAFPEPLARGAEGPRVLWRIDGERRDDLRLLIVSPHRPDLTHLVEQAGWPAADSPGWSSYDYGTFLQGLREGSRWAFRLTANPVRHVRRDGDPPEARSKRVPHLSPRHQLSWLVERQERCGFAVIEKPVARRLTERGDSLEVTVRNSQQQLFTRPSAGGAKADVQLYQVTFEGRLRVTDPVAFRGTLCRGIGKARAYGCGLMTLAPVVRARAEQHDDSVVGSAE